MERIVTKPTKIDLHIHSAASIVTKDKGKKQLADCDKDHVIATKTMLMCCFAVWRLMASTCAQSPTTIALTKTFTSL